MNDIAVAFIKRVYQDFVDIMKRSSWPVCIMSRLSIGPLFDDRVRIHVCMPLHYYVRVSSRHSQNLPIILTERLQPGLIPRLSSVY